MAPHSGSLADFGSRLQSQGFGISSTNPDDMQNNCVSVAIAHTLGFPTVKDLWTSIGMPNRPDQAVSIYTVFSLLRRAGYRSIYQEYEGPGTYETEILANYPIAVWKSQVSKAIVCFKRTDNTGHAVNLSVYATTAGFSSATADFKDFQHSDKGERCKKEVEEAARLWVLYVWPRDAYGE